MPGPGPGLPDASQVPAPEGEGAAGGGIDVLPGTGGPAEWLLWLGLLLVGAGASLLLVVRRRRRHTRVLS